MDKLNLRQSLDTVINSATSATATNSSPFRHDPGVRPQVVLVTASPPLLDRWPASPPYPTKPFFFIHLYTVYVYK